MRDVAIFHRNLRIEDNAALYNASLNNEYFSLFVFDKKYWSQADRSVNQLKFALDSLSELEAELKKFNVDLYVSKSKHSYESYDRDRIFLKKFKKTFKSKFSQFSES